MVGRWWCIAALGCAFALAASAFGPGMASAAPSAPQTRYVNGELGSDTANDCLASVTPCQTIQHGIDEADAGDSVEAAGGTYLEHLTITKPLTLSGPNVGIDPNAGSRGKEAVINGTGGSGIAIAVQSSGVAIDGFTVTTGDVGSISIRSVGADTDGLRISNDIVDGSLTAVSLEAGGDAIAVEHNSLKGARYDIYLGPVTFSDLTISGNLIAAPTVFYGIFNAGSGVIEGLELNGNRFQAPSDIGAEVSDARVSGNEFEVDNPGEMALQIALHDSIVFQNTFDGLGTTGCLQLFGSQYGLVPSSDVRVTENSFVDCNAYGIQLSPDVEAIEILGNSIVGSYDGIDTRLLPAEAPWDLSGKGIVIAGNSITGSTHLGVDNTVEGTLDARDNWWGCNGGPGTPGCDGAGAAVLTSPNVVLTAAASVARLPSGSRATVSAALETDSAGAAVPGVPGGDVSFTAALGSFAPPTATLVHGQAASTFAAGMTGGPAGITVALANQRLTVPLTIVAPSTVVKPRPVRPAPAPPAPRAPRLNRPSGPLAVAGSKPTVGRLACASACHVESKAGSVKIGGRRFKLKVTMPHKLDAGRSAPIKVVLRKSVRQALARRGVGMVVVEVKLADATGKDVIRRIKVKIKPKRGRM
jgi:nitrous oxidase accessory protein NosD